MDLLQDEIRKMAADDPTLGGHGGMWESALVMAVRPDWADLSRAERVTGASFASQLQTMPPEALSRIRDATPEFGEKLLGIAVGQAVSRARALLGETGAGDA